LKDFLLRRKYLLTSLLAQYKIGKCFLTFSHPEVKDHYYHIPRDPDYYSSWQPILVLFM
jgi:hypothetical protein